MGEFSDFALVPEQGAVPEMEQLDAQMRARIEALAAKLDVGSSAAVLGYGARVQKEMGGFSDIALERMTQRDIEPISSTLDALAEEIKACSFARAGQGLLRRIIGRASSLSDIRRAYEKAEPKINALADEMIDRRVALMRDSALLDRIYERNEALYREVCSLLVVGEEAVRQARARGEDEQAIARLERRIEDIRVTQLTSSQLAAQIRMVQKNDEMTCEKLRTAAEVTIPLWKNQMAAALGLARAADSLEMGRRAQREASEGIREGTDELLSQRAAYRKAARESERGRAEQTAQELLRELEEIERELSGRKTAGNA